MSVHKHARLAMSGLPADTQISRPDQLRPLILWYELIHPNTHIEHTCKCLPQLALFSPRSFKLDLCVALYLSYSFTEGCSISGIVWVHVPIFQLQQIK